MQLLVLAPRALDRDDDAASEREEEFARFVTEHAESAWRGAYAVLGDREEAVDAIRRGLDDAWKRGRLAPAAVTRAVLRRSLDALLRRDAPTERLVDLLPAFSADGALGAPARAWPRDRIARLERSGCIPDLIRRLPDPQRTALLLRDRVGLPAAEVARVLDCSEDEVRDALREGRLALHALIGRRIEGDDDTGDGTEDGAF